MTLMDATPEQACSWQTWTPHERWLAVEAHRAALLITARRRTLNVDDAEDCVSEAMLRAVQATELDSSRLGAWLCATVMRLAADSHRVRDRERRAFVRHASREPEALPSHSDGVCDRAEAAWLVQQLVQVRGREADVMQARIAGATVAETARALRISDKAAENAWTRLRKKGLAALASTASVATVLSAWTRRAGVLAAPTVLVAGGWAVSHLPAEENAAPLRITLERESVTERPFLPAASTGGPSPSTAGVAAATTPAVGAAGQLAAPAAPVETRLATRPVEVGETAVIGSATVERRDEDRSMLQSAADCLDDAVALLSLQDPCTA